MYDSFESLGGRDLRIGIIVDVFLNGKLEWLKNLLLFKFRLFGINKSE